MAGQQSNRREFSAISLRRIVPIGECQCGCGCKTGTYARTSIKRGVREGGPKRFITGHTHRAADPWIVCPNTGCWLWQAGTDDAGYGKASPVVDGGTTVAHRQVFERFKGKIVDDLDLDHLCRTHNCVNPDHLEPVTPKVNILRGEGFAAKRAAATHCQRGHPFTDKLGFNKRTGFHRRCWICYEDSRKRKAVKIGK